MTSCARGDLLVRFEIPSLAADTASKRAEIDRANARLQNARSAQARAKDLFDRGVGARKDLEDADRELADVRGSARRSEGQSHRIIHARGARCSPGHIRRPRRETFAQPRRPRGTRLVRSDPARHRSTPARGCCGGAIRRRAARTARRGGTYPRRCGRSAAGEGCFAGRGGRSGDRGGAGAPAIRSSCRVSRPGRRPGRDRDRRFTRTWSWCRRRP